MGIVAIVSFLSALVGKGELRHKAWEATQVRQGPDCSGFYVSCQSMFRA